MPTPMRLTRSPLISMKSSKSLLSSLVNTDALDATGEEEVDDEDADDVLDSPKTFEGDQFWKPSLRATIRAISTDFIISLGLLKGELRRNSQLRNQ